MKKWFFIPSLIFITILLSIVLLNQCNPEDYILYQSSDFTVFPNRIEQGEHTAIAHNNSHISSNYPGLNSKEWQLNTNLSKYPQIRIKSRLLNAIYQAFA